MDNFLENLRSAIGEIQDSAREVAKQEMPRIRSEQAMNGSRTFIPDENKYNAAARSTLYDDPYANKMLTLDIAENYEDLVNVIKQYEKADNPKDKIRVLDESRKRFRNTDGISRWFDSIRRYTLAADRDIYDEDTKNVFDDIAENQHQWTYDAYNKYFGKKKLV